MSETHSKLKNNITITNNKVNVINNTINVKLSILTNIAKQLNVDTDDIDNFKDIYKLQSLPIIYAMVVSDSEAVNNEFELFISSECILERIDALGSLLLTKYKSKINNTGSVHSLISEFKQININAKLIYETNNTCINGHGPLVNEYYLYESRCLVCGYVEAFPQGILEDTAENSKGPYKPSKHCEQWVSRIFAMEHINIPESLIAGIKRCAKRDGIAEIDLTCKCIRDTYLKELHQTKYNGNVPKIRRIINGISPPQPTREEYMRICSLFDLIDGLFLEIKPKNFSSRRYYPHFIRKIIEIIYADRPKVKFLILEGIHIQEQKTTQINDELWEMICEKSDGQLTFSKTKKIMYYNR